MSIAPLVHQWIMCSSACAGQRVLMQRVTASPSGRETGSPHTGHSAGISEGVLAAVTVFGDGTDDLRYYVPARSTTTVSPIRTPFSLT